MLSVLLGTGYLTQKLRKSTCAEKRIIGYICVPSVGEKQIAKFKTVFYDVIYIRLIAQLNKG